MSADVKLETENDEDDGVEAEEIPRFISNNVYHAKKALRWVDEL